PSARPTSRQRSPGVLIGVPTESPTATSEAAPAETRVAATPETVRRLIWMGHQVLVQHGAGAAASYPDEQYAEAGARLGAGHEAWGADAVVTIDAPDESEIAALADGAYLVAQLAPAQHPELLQTLAERGVTALAMDAVPRISRAQSLDVLSSMANLG